MAVVSGTGGNDTITVAFISAGVSGFPTPQADTISGLDGDDLTRVAVGWHGPGSYERGRRCRRLPGPLRHPA